MWNAIWQHKLRNIFSICHKLVLSISVGIHESDKCKRDVISRRKVKRRKRGRERARMREREREWRFRRVIGSAGVDAILSSIPHQPPPGNLYPPVSFSCAHTHHRPFSHSPSPFETDANTKQPFPPKMETDKSWSTTPLAANSFQRISMGIFAHFKGYSRLNSFAIFDYSIQKYML